MVLHGFVMEDGEVEGESELDGVARREGDGVGLVVSGEGGLLDLLEVITLGVLGDVSVVVSDHLDEESLGLSVARFGEDLLVDHVDDSLAVILELLLNSVFVSSEGISELGVLGVLLNSSDSAASGSLGGDEVLEGDERRFLSSEVTSAPFSARTNSSWSTISSKRSAYSATRARKMYSSTLDIRQKFILLIITV